MENTKRTAADIDVETLDICTIDYTACADDDDTDLSALGREVVDWMRNGDFWDVCEDRSGWTYVSDDADLSQWECERVVRVNRDGIDTGGWYLLNVA
jgi:hypothetical protein